MTWIFSKRCEKLRQKKSIELHLPKMFKMLLKKTGKWKRILKKR
jgi:hypothetical protein